MKPTSSLLLPGDVVPVRVGVEFGVETRSSSERGIGEAKYDFPNGGTKALSSDRALICSVRALIFALADTIK